MPEIILYRAITSGDTEKTSGIQKIESDGVQNYNIKDTRRQTDNPEPFSNRNRKPDTGNAGTFFTVELLYDESASRSPDIAILRNWKNDEQKEQFVSGLV